MPPRDRTKRRVRPRQERAVATVDAILEAAARVLEARGFARTTTNQIAEVAGVNVALLYRYFAGKEAIVGELVERAAARTLDAVRTAIDGHAGAPLAVATRALLVAAVDTPGLPPALHRELVERVDATKRRAVVDALRAQLAELFAEFLRGRTGELRTLPDPRATLFVLGHALEASSHAIAFYRPMDVGREAAIDALNELVLRLLAPVSDRRLSPRRRRSS